MTLPQPMPFFSAAANFAAGNDTPREFLERCLSNVEEFEPAVGAFVCHPVKEPLLVRRAFGIVFQDPSLDDQLTAAENMELHGVLYGVPRVERRERVEALLRFVGLWERRDDYVKRFSGGMKRRLEIARALQHRPRILFLDEPTAGVDVELRKDMWQLVRALRASGVTIILTTHYIEEAEEMADRVGVINKGEIILVEDKVELMRKLGRKQLTLELHQRLDAIPAALDAFHLTLGADGKELTYTYDTKGERTGITALLDALNVAGIRFKDLHTTQSSLEDIFVGLLRHQP